MNKPSTHTNLNPPLANPVKLAVVGSRDFSDYRVLEEFILSHYSIDAISHIISGGAKGADALAFEFANKHNIPTLLFKADWKKYGRGAGIVRNKDIVQTCDAIILFWDGKSKGTQNSLKLAQKLNKHITICDYNPTDDSSS